MTSHTKWASGKIDLFDAAMIFAQKTHKNPHSETLADEVAKGVAHLKYMVEQTKDHKNMALRAGNIVLEFGNKGTPNSWYGEVREE